MTGPGASGRSHPLEALAPVLGRLVLGLAGAALVLLVGARLAGAPAADGAAVWLWRAGLALLLGAPWAVVVAGVWVSLVRRRPGWATVCLGLAALAALAAVAALT